MGKFKDPNNTLDRHYQVQPSHKWLDMTRYNSFVCEYDGDDDDLFTKAHPYTPSCFYMPIITLADVITLVNGVKYYSEGFIFVANSSTIERQRNPGDSAQPRKKSDDDWVARILEIRASDEHHVYARVYWMYWPDELPVGTQEGRRTVHGRQSYHGQNELIASNHSKHRCIHLLPQESSCFTVTVRL